MSRFLTRVALLLYFFARISGSNPADLRWGMLFPLAAYPLILLCLGSMMANIRLERERKRGLIATAITVSGIRFLFILSYYLILKRVGLSPVQVWVPGH